MKQIYFKSIEIRCMDGPDLSREDYNKLDFSNKDTISPSQINIEDLKPVGCGPLFVGEKKRERKI